MMGNVKNMQKIKDELNLKDEKRFFAPVGLPLGNGSHKSIALSICAQIEAFKNAKS